MNVSEKSTRKVQTKSKSKIKLTKKHKIVIGIIGSILCVSCIVGIIFLIIYGATIGTVSESGYCLANESCLPNRNLSCVNSKCTCKSSLTWNSSSSKCESINNLTVTTTSAPTSATTTTTTTTTTSTPVLTPIQKAVKLVYSKNYSTLSITSFNGNLYSQPFGIKYLYTTAGYFYFVDYTANALLMYNDSGSYVKHVTVGHALFIEAMPWGNIYVARYVDARIDIYDQALNYLSYYAVSTYVSNAFGIRYFPITGYLYEVDIGTNWVNAFDFSLTRIPSESYVGFGYSIYCINFFQTYTYIGTTNNVILIVQNKALVATIQSVCTINHPTDLAIDSSGYMFLACYYDKRVYLFYVNGTNNVRIGLFLTTPGNPAGVTVDKYGRIAVTMTNPSRMELYTLIEN